MFIVDKLYSRQDIYDILSVPVEKRKGSWNTGYRQYNGEYYVFVNINTMGRTGHNYNNHWENNLLYWRAKNGSKITDLSIKNMISTSYKVHIFTRTDSKNTYFIYQGLGIPERVEDTSPVTVYWRFENDYKNIYDEYDEIVNETYIEGTVRERFINIYERNRQARIECIKYYGCRCIICGIDFKEIYGEIGEGFIHVHHLKQLSDINNEYEVDPINDLRPVCPNCHTMLHKRRVPYSIEEMKKIIEKNKVL